MNLGGLSASRLARLRPVLAAHVERGALPGLVALVCRGQTVHVEAIGTLAVGGQAPMQRDTIFRIASMTKPVTAVAAMILVEECRLRLDEPVDGWLPELANRRVLREPGAPLSDTVPAKRPITLRDLLTFRAGFGLVLTGQGRSPIQKAMDEAGLTPGPLAPTCSAQEWMRRLGGLPLVHQPGERWLYHTGSDVLGVLIARAAGQSFPSFVQQRIFEPLGMTDTGFHVPPAKLARLPPVYYGLQATMGLAPPPAGAVGEASAELKLFEDAQPGRWSRPPEFPAGGGGLVSTVDDYLAFCRMMLGKGRLGSRRILSRPAVELMTSDQLKESHREGARLLLPGGTSWGFGVAVTTRRNDLSATPGRFGWSGGHGTSAYSDPVENLVGILMTQRMMDSPVPPPWFADFWTTVYQAIDD